MHSETFYSTAAQIFPTLLIALVVELGSMMRVIARDRKRLEQTYPDYAARAARDMTTVARLTAGSGVAFLAGETLAVLCLGFRWYNAGTFIAICTLLLILSLGLTLLVVVRLTNEMIPVG